MRAEVEGSVSSMLYHSRPPYANFFNLLHVCVIHLYMQNVFFLALEQLMNREFKH